MERGLGLCLKCGEEQVLQGHMPIRYKQERHLVVRSIGSLKGAKQLYAISLQPSAQSVIVHHEPASTTVSPNAHVSGLLLHIVAWTTSCSTGASVVRNSMLAVYTQRAYQSAIKYTSIWP